MSRINSINHHHKSVIHYFSTSSGLNYPENVICTNVTILSLHVQFYKTCYIITHSNSGIKLQVASAEVTDLSNKTQ